MKKFDENNLEEVIKEMFSICWYIDTYPWSIEKLNKIDDWYMQWTMSEEEKDDWRNYLKEYLKPFVLKYRLDKEVEHFILNYWFKDEPKF